MAPLLWIAAHSATAVTQLRQPPVVLLSQEQATALYHRQSGTQARAPKVDTSIQGHFDCSGATPGTIYLHGLDVTDPPPGRLSRAHQFGRC